MDPDVLLWGFFAPFVIHVLDGVRQSGRGHRKLVDAEVEVRRVWRVLKVAGVKIEPLTEEDAELAGARRSTEGGEFLFPRRLELPRIDGAEHPAGGAHRRSPPGQPRPSPWSTSHSEGRKAAGATRPTHA